jgi:hypothetical protein
METSSTEPEPPPEPQRLSDQGQVRVTVNDMPVPEFYGDPGATDVMAGIAAPLLVAASITIIGVIVQQPTSLRWPGLCLALLVLSALLLTMCVQFGFLAKRHAAGPEQVAQWWLKLDAERRANRVAAEILQNRRPMEILTDISRWLYGSGIVVVWLAIGSAVVPSVDSLQPEFRWTAAGLSWFAAFIEFLWLILSRIKPRFFTPAP